MAFDKSKGEVGRSEPPIPSDQLYFIETFLRQRGDHQTLLAVDALIIRDDIAASQKTADLQTIIQGALNGKR